MDAPASAAKLRVMATFFARARDARTTAVADVPATIPSTESATTMDAPSEDDAIARGAVCGRALIFVSFRAGAGARNGTARSNE